MPRQLKFKNTHENVRKTDANFLFVQHNSVPCVVSNESLCGLACTAMNELTNSLGHLHIILNAWWRCIDLAIFFWQRSRTSTTTINTKLIVEYSFYDKIDRSPPPTTTGTEIAQCHSIHEMVWASYRFTLVSAENIFVDSISYQLSPPLLYDLFIAPCGSSSHRTPLTEVSRNWR